MELTRLNPASGPSDPFVVKPKGDITEAKTRKGGKRLT